MVAGKGEAVGRVERLSRVGIFSVDDLRAQQ
jgi:hypothetical protein